MKFCRFIKGEVDHTTLSVSGCCYAVIKKIFFSIHVEIVALLVQEGGNEEMGLL